MVLTVYLLGLENMKVDRSAVYKSNVEASSITENYGELEQAVDESLREIDQEENKRAEEKEESSKRRHSTIPARLSAMKL